MRRPRAGWSPSPTRWRSAAARRCGSTASAPAGSAPRPGRRPRGATNPTTRPPITPSTRSAVSAAPRTSARWRCTCCRRCPASPPARTSSPTAA
ncbi:hypothetical protein G6F61_014860 [Rhizopus arrhizus]|nr:hypothetical protein G6F61_014860 [Rhizopus arrhizus]